MNFNIGDKVIHQAHGEGTIIVLSPSRQMAVVEYPTSNPHRHYRRTHSVLNLTKKES